MTTRPLDLLGRKHRAVYISGLPDYLHEDYATFLCQKCGDVEEWTHDDEIITIAFRKSDSIPTVKSFTRMKYCGYQPVLTIAKDHDAAAAAAAGRKAGCPLSITGPSASSSTAANGGGVSSSAREMLQRIKEQQAQQRREREERQKKQREDGGGGGDFGDSDGAKECFLAEHGARQVAALIYMTQDWIEMQEAEIRGLEGSLECLNKSVNSEEKKKKEEEEDNERRAKQERFDQPQKSAALPKVAASKTGVVDLMAFVKKPKD